MTRQKTEQEDGRLRAWTDFVLSYNRLMGVLEGEMQTQAGITLSQYDVLLRLGETEGRMKMSELADAIVYSTGGLTRLFERMREAGLVRREPSAVDRRVIYAVLTEQGMERLRAASAVHLDGVRKHFSTYLADDEVNTVATFLGRLRDSLRGPPQMPDQCESGRPGSEPRGAGRGDEAGNGGGVGAVTQAMPSP